MLESSVSAVEFLYVDMLKHESPVRSPRPGVHPLADPAMLHGPEARASDPLLVLLFFPLEPRVYVLGEQEVKYISGFRTKVIDWLEVMVMLDVARALIGEADAVDQSPGSSESPEAVVREWWRRQRS